LIDPSNPDFENTPTSSQRPRFGYAPADHAAPPCVTIVTPFYNTGLVFHETARSVLQQSLQQWEWLIINDGSTDPVSLSILESYRDADHRIQVIDHTVNKGPSASRNTGFRAARTPYVVQLDSDDLLEPTAVEKWLWFLESYPEYAFGKGYSVGFGAQEYLWEKGFHNGTAFLNANLVDPTSIVRKTVHHAVGGYDEAIRHGLEDWDFWLHCANLGYWGGTVPEYLDWYRRRSTHGDRWLDWDNAERQSAFMGKLRQRYPQLWHGGFPQVEIRWHMPNDTVPNDLPCENHLRKEKPRLLMVVPWLTMGGADKFNLDLLQQLTQRGWEVTVATTLKGDYCWLPQFARYTPDIFVLHHFLRMVDYPRFLRYLIESRQPDVVLVSNSEFGYLLLPFLRAFCPQPAYADFCHIEEEHWKKGGFPRISIDFLEQLDLTIVTSLYLKQWMVERGGTKDRIEVCYIDVDPNHWKPDRQIRATVRKELGIEDEVPVILYAGRLVPQKQPKVFAQVMSHLRARGFGFQALVAGDGEDREWLDDFLRRHHLGKQVKMLGPASSERMQALMAASDIFFLPSRWEGIALTIYEAMACGLAVAGADVGGQRELVTKECGILLTPGEEQVEVQQYAEALAQLLRNPDLRAAMGHQARSRICEHFRLEFMGDRMVALFEEARFLRPAHPRPAVSPGLGLACATQAVEYMRLHQVADMLWLEREGRKEKGLPLSAFFYVRLRRIGRPLYLWGLQRGWHWMTPLKDLIKRGLLTRFGQSV